VLNFSGLTLQWPWALLSLAVLPLFWLAWQRYRTSSLSNAARYPGLSVAQQLTRWSYLPLGFFLLGGLLLCIGLARPSALFSLPQRQLDLMIALDTSGSMRADDVKPSRLAAAKQLLYPFIETLPSHARVGLVSVAASAALAQSPTTDRDALRKAVERLEAQRGTALGSGIVIALATLKADANLDVEKLTTGRSSRQWNRAPNPADEKKPEPLEPGSNENMAIILVSDGKTTVGIETAQAARIAADLGIRIYTIGVGTAKGAVLKADGVNQRVRLDEGALKDTALTTLGEYFEAGKPADLAKITGALKSRLVLQKPRQTEITALFAGAGGLLLLIAAMISLFTRQRVL
jgi:Ca-activated chloride channel homolog